LAKRRWLATVAGVLMLSIGAWLTGCATPEPPPPPKMVWPEPPEVARIEFVRTIVDEKDVDKDNTANQSFLRFLAGEKPTKYRIAEPMGVAVSDDGQRLYVSDFAQMAVMIFDFEKKTANKLGGDPKPLAAPLGVALDQEENLYVAESARKGVQVFDKNGKELRFISDPSIERPVAVAVDRARKKLYIVDSGHTDSQEHTVKIFDLQGKMLGKIGKQIGDVAGSFLFPTNIVVDTKGNVYVSDTLNSRVQMFDPEGKFVQAFGKRGNAFGMFDKPKGVAVDTFGNVHVVDSAWSNVQIFNSKAQVLMYFGGRGTVPGLMQNPSAMAIDKDNKIYIADLLNHRVSVYRLINTTAADSVIAEEPAKKK